MKTSLLKRSLRTAGLALALGLGLAAASHSAQAATVQITLNRTFTTADSSGPRDVTGDSILDSIQLYNSGYALEIVSSGATVAYAFADNDPEFGFTSNTTSTSQPFTFTDARINGGVSTAGWAQGVGSIGNGNSLSVTLTRIVFNDASTTAPSFSESAGPYNEWSPTSTAVPEPGTFIPAAALVMGALLRRRRSRSHRSGRATA